jgi:hypothetical protein
MSKTAPVHELRPLLFLHALLMFGLAATWLYYCWSATAPAFDNLLGRTHGPLAVTRALDVLSAAATDILLGISTIFLFAFGTGLYVRRVQIWIDARSAGDAVAYGSANLKEQALAANARRKVQ